MGIDQDFNADQRQIIGYLAKDMDKVEKSIVEMQKTLTQMRIDIELLKKAGVIPRVEVVDSKTRIKDVAVGSSAIIGLVELLKALAAHFLKMS